MLSSLFMQIFAYLCYFYLKVSRPKIRPFDADKYRKDHDWSSGDRTVTADSSSIRPFRIQVSDDVIDDLKDRLSKRRTQESIVSDFEYGFNSRHLQQVVKYWTDIYDWRKEELVLNSYDHYKTRIEGIDIHYVHVKPDDSNSRLVVPLLLVHGWPGSFYEFYKSIPFLRTGTDDHAFELIIPSIPGYGFSEAPQRPGLNAIHMGRLFVKLMQRLGHERFVFQGGDWGSVIGRSIAVVYPEVLLGYHTNMPTAPMSVRNIVRIIAASIAPHLFSEDPQNETKRLLPLKDWFFMMMRESGYMHIQATKPDTVGTALNNDPAGLAAYILEKFSTWTDESFRKRPDGGLSLRYTTDELLTNVMIYWVNGNITSSQRLYKEQFSATDETSHQIVGVKTGVVFADNELFGRPLSLLRESFVHIIHTSVQSAGHFLAFEQPRAFAEDVTEFVKKCNQ